MSIVLQIMNDVRKKETEANRKMYVGNAEKIIIHPECFYDVVGDPKYYHLLQSFPNGTHKLSGYPLDVSESVDKWEVVIKKPLH